MFHFESRSSKHKLLHLYTLHNQHLFETDSAKKLGVTIASDLQWNQHVNNITDKANSILGLLCRNLRIPSQTIKTHDYKSLMRPHLEYVSTVWDPHTQKHIYMLDMIQCRAARSHVTVIITSAASLRWSATWAGRRRNMRLCKFCMMYKIAHTSPAARGGNLAKIPPNQFIDDFGRGSSVESESE